mmetsp:Transcript_11473/g.22537  ORF Transcript_11473/g.22537 Transcript_11473/m.22537 type:complete len:221 (-) Transcript_11473:969-1631(-)
MLSPKRLIIMSSGLISKDKVISRDTNSRSFYSSLDSASRRQRTENRQGLAESSLHSQGVSAPPGYSDDSNRQMPSAAQHKPFDADADILSRGCDILTVCPRNQSSSLMSLWSEEAADLPEFSLPNVYYIDKPILKMSQFQKYSAATLFYIFYGFPKDLYQSLAANELYKRGWKYDLRSSMWFISDKGTWKSFNSATWSEETSNVPSSLLKLEEFNSRPRS